MKFIEIYTDGACLGNPGPGGYGAVLIYRQPHPENPAQTKVFRKEIAQGYQRTTNNRMEMMAAVAALEALNQSTKIKLTTDSQYLRQGITQWVKGWKRNHWMTRNRTPVKNVDLWQRLDALAQAHDIEWCWVKGHSGHPENERCDVLGKQAAQQEERLVDSGYQE